MTNICYEAIPLILFMVSLLIGFVKINAIFHVFYEDPTKGQVDSDFVKRFYILFMNTQGSITAPSLDDSIVERDSGGGGLIFIFYVFVTAMFLSQ
jgi:hypothetical protein